ncbi:MAG: electron transport complex subunit RsxG [Xanthomonadales bacterium]|nr:electron transport complex subunit RsxG [Xanthomonadales bacterium]
MTEGQKKNPSKTLPLILKASLTLAIITFIGVALLAGTWELTEEKIAEQQRKAVLTGLNQILPAESYDNELQDDTLIINAQGFFKHPKAVVVFRARKQGQPIAVILQMTTGEGYNGDISLLVGIYNDGTIAGVRVTQQRETPGLGDAIDSRRSDWALGFKHRALGDPIASKWTVKRNGGDFDQFTGATISPRAVIKAVRRALEYERNNREALYHKNPIAKQQGKNIKELSAQ